MRIASVLIGGTEMVQSTLVRGFSISRDVSQRTGRASLIVLAIPANIFMTPSPTGALFNDQQFGTAIFGGPTSAQQAILLTGATVEIWDGTGNSAGSMFNEATFGSILPGGSSVGVKRFAGTVTKITPRAVTLKPNGLGYTEYTLECQDYTALLDTAVVSPVTLPAGMDRDMILYIMSHTLPDINTDNVDPITPLDAVVLNGVSARQALESVAALSGGNFWIDENKNLHYHSPMSLAAPFGISDQADSSMTFFAQFAGFQYAEDWSLPGNRITVIGGGGNPPTITIDDAASQSQYGRVYTRVVLDQSLLTGAAVRARADVELARYKQPQKSGTFTTDQQGLDVGQLLSIANQALRIGGQFLIRRVVTAWPFLHPEITRYTVEFGDWNPDLVRFLRTLAGFTAPQPQFNSTVSTYDASTTLTVPPGVTTITVECWGPGGNGGGQNGGGGGGGAYARGTVPVVPGAVMTISAPAGATELPSWFGSPTTVAADAGKNGTSGGSTGLAGAGGLASASFGSTVASGLPGQNGMPTSGGGGGAGGNSANNAILGDGAGGAGGTSFGGSDGVSPGGGGGGGGTGAGGGQGAPGRVKLTYSIA